MLTKLCRLCGSGSLEVVIDLGLHPLADTFLTPEMCNEAEVFYPLRVFLCNSCGYVGSYYIVSAVERYQTHEYSYTTSNSSVAIDHFKEMAEELGGRLSLNAGNLAVDIGSNDGTLLNVLHAGTACQVLGVEPSKNMSELSRSQGVETLNDFFNTAVAAEITRRGGAKVITATNVFNHIDDLGAFMSACARALTSDGMFVFELPYLQTLIEETAFDTIYLEHVSYFSVEAFAPFFERHGFYIHALATNKYMGGSIRVYLTRDHTLSDLPVVQSYIAGERNRGLREGATYSAFMNRVQNLRMHLCKELYEVKEKGGNIIGIGAATKGNTLLNYCKIDSALLNFVVDTSPFKIGKYTPGSRIPIKSEQEITSEITHALILPWNIAQMLMGKLAHLHLSFIVPHGLV